jgi:hypothetical protein
VIGLQALAKLAERISSSEVDISVVFSHSGGGSPTTMKINKANAMILQKQEVGVCDITYHMTVICNSDTCT